jgi:23S rRNA (uracil1939-C5)-methyltransferase
MAKPKRGDILELRIESLAYGGGGVARHDGMVAFVRFAYPGETVRAEVIRRRKGHVHARTVEVVSPSPDRVAPMCAHFGTCGSCVWQALDYDAQCEAKRRVVVDSLERIGGIENADRLVLQIIPSPHTSHHRNKTEFAVERDREGIAHVGLHRGDGRWGVFDLEECHLPHPLAARLAVWLRDAMARHGLSAYHVHRADGLIRHLTVRHSEATGEHLAAIVTSAEKFPNRDALFSEMVGKFPELSTAVHVVNPTRATIARGEIAAEMHGTGYMTEHLGGRRFRVGSMSFFQTNTSAAERLVQVVLERIGRRPDTTLYDLYCGAGVFGIVLSDRVAHVVGVEAEPETVADALCNARENGITNARFETGLTERWLTEHRDDPDLKDGLILLDPPRAGLHPRAVRRLLEIAPPEMIYVSCNPTTLARDVEALSQSYTMESAIPVDLFPHTYHVETVATLRANSPTRK